MVRKMSREERTKRIIKLLEEYGIIDPPDHQDTPPPSQQTSQTVHQAEN
jgi:hypothetical protein